MKLLVYIIFLLIPFFGFSQTGPGGVGANDGTSNLEFWYMAEGETYNDGDPVTSISDRSGNGRTITAVIPAEEPSYTAVNVGANNMPSLSFNLNQELETTYQGNSNENMSFGLVLNYISDGGLNVAIQHGGRNTIGISSADFYTDFVGGSNHTSTTTSSGWTYHFRSFANTGTNRLKYYEKNTNTDNFTHNIENRTSNTWIGGHGSGGGTGFKGEIAEVFKFSGVLTSAEQIIIANYLGAKYDITLTTSDLYNEDDNGNGDFDFDVAGIGQASDGSNHTDSQGTGIVRILNPAGLSNNEFLIWGHNGGELRATEVSDVPSPGVAARLQRVWGASEVNASGTSVDVGAVDIRFDLTGLGAITASDLVLLIDNNDGLFADETPITGATSLGSNIYEFAAVTAITDNARFTIGTIDATQTPLPIELLSFNATSIDNGEKVKLDWQTASETNNDYFTIERSIDGNKWEKFSEIDGAGNSTSILNYSEIDYHPYSETSYYRLKQTDYDGKYSYSLIESISLGGLSTLNIFPNPTKNLVTIKSTKSELQHIKVFNSLGQNITSRVKQNDKNDSTILLDLSNLAAGEYLIKTKTLTSKIYKQ